MQRWRARSVAALAVVLLVCGVSGSSLARTLRTRVHANLRSTMHHSARPTLKTTLHSKSHTVAHVPMTGEEVVPGTMQAEEVASSGTADQMPVDGKEYKLRMDNMHTGESISIVYRIGNTYIPEALEKLNYFLRDHNTNDVSNYDPKEFDVLHAMMARLHKLDGVIDVVCGYRTPGTNADLRENSPLTGVAEHSQHMEGHAIDLRVPGVATARIRDAALSLHAGGVGYYPTSQFVHVDVGPVREWVWGTRQRRTLARRIHSSRSGIVSGQ